MKPVVKAAAGLAALGAGCLAYGAGYEVRAFRVRHVDIPCLPAGSAALKVLHLSDIHMTPGQHRKQAWLRSLAALEPDLVVNTGDNLSHQDSVPVVLGALGDLLDLPGVFVLGSNDYWGPVLKSPLRYFLPNSGPKLVPGPALPWRRLRDGFADAGWLDLSNARGELKVGGSVLAFSGVDDPHLRYDDLAAVAGPADPVADLRVGVTPRAVPPRPRRLHPRRVRRDLRGPHARRPGAGAGLRRPGHELRHRHPAVPRVAPPPASAAASAWLQRLGRMRHLAIRPLPLLLLPGGDPGDPDRRRFSDARGRCVDSAGFGLWRSLVARVVRDDEAAGSNPVSPTNENRPAGRTLAVARG